MEYPYVVRINPSTKWVSSICITPPGLQSVVTPLTQLYQTYFSNQMQLNPPIAWLKIRIPVCCHVYSAHLAIGGCNFEPCPRRNATNWELVYHVDLSSW